MLAFTVQFVAKIMVAEPANTAPTGVVPTLLTGGGFAFLGIVMTGLFLWNKNKAESANTVAQGAATWAEGMSKELTAYKQWAGRRRQVDHEHTEWDRETFEQLETLVCKCEEAGIVEPGSVNLTPPPSLEVPFIDPYTDPQLPATRRRGV
jgi:hypothetical protein